MIADSKWLTRLVYQNPNNIGSFSNTGPIIRPVGAALISKVYISVTISKTGALRSHATMACII